MIQIKSKIRKWGNSFGVIIPQKVLNNSKIKEGDEICIFINPDKENLLKELFNSFKFKDSTNKILKQIDKELEDL
ncbi:AbrB/MazE/SpoVT family DNA-binding domain-containing protein [Candidatus Babeliales bacterium]|nr:AbrB/MazE/SpoVT family DNA-binding domain-containing protein [Candidatus Babeliales bacterium]MCF7910146.1 AbrB/MazE/SpoVT family DNA-binding domain-containing protein [Candidatus Pacearchaeota archaeon]